MSMRYLSKLIASRELTIQDMAFIYEVYNIGFIVKDGAIKGFTK